MRHDGWRARTMTAVTPHDTAAGAGGRVQRLCRFAPKGMALSGGAALAVGVHAEFSLPLTVRPGGFGTSDPCHDRPGMLSNEHLADALAAADIAGDSVLCQQYAPAWPSLAELLATVGTDRIVVHQATGMIAAQLDDTAVNALARLRAAAFASGHPVYDVAQDVVKRRVAVR